MGNAAAIEGVTEPSDSSRRALEIITALSQGKDPLTGEILPSTHVVQQGDVVRALMFATVVLGEHISKQSRRTSGLSNAGKAWTKAEDQRLVSAFDEGVHVSELAKNHARSVSAIEARLVRLGKLSADDFQPTFAVKAKSYED